MWADETRRCACMGVRMQGRARAAAPNRQSPPLTCQAPTHRHVPHPTPPHSSPIRPVPNPAPMQGGYGCSRAPVPVGFEVRALLLGRREPRAGDADAACNARGACLVPCRRCGGWCACPGCRRRGRGARAVAACAAAARLLCCVGGLRSAHSRVRWNDCRPQGATQAGQTAISRGRGRTCCARRRAAHWLMDGPSSPSSRRSVNSDAGKLYRKPACGIPIRHRTDPTEIKETASHVFNV